MKTTPDKAELEPLTPVEFETLFGSTTPLARKLGEKVPTVASWKNRGIIPADKVLKLSRATGIPVYRIRPDLYPESEFARAS